VCVFAENTLNKLAQDNSRIFLVICRDLKIQPNRFAV
jgi:hypothetical protein